MPDKLIYKLSTEADQDLMNIFDYTLIEYGEDQAISYLLNFDTFFSELIYYPELGRERNEIKVGLRSFSIASHIVFYSILEDHVT